ncbi:hypothetical protein TRIUR3_01667 [Triticum urartu]|uniref:Uncharacterized protein n=2 Tax=Triticum TaxID=4564 RepID=A0A9R1R1C4_TRITD|nr:hypothetical protein TRIUR3_01667 [Triticum urartu]VAH24844.1 unnamed protein product [Triticum turgidum subsp. durum]
MSTKFTGFVSISTPRQDRSPSVPHPTSMPVKDCRLCLVMEETELAIAMKAVRTVDPGADEIRNFVIHVRAKIM